MTDKKNQTYHHGSLRDALLKEAALIIREESLSSLSIRKLAKKCDVTCTALYRHFPNKDALVVAVLQRGYELLLHHLKNIVEQYGDDTLETLRELGKGYVDFAQRHKNFFYIMYGSDSFSINKSYVSNELSERANKVYQLLKTLIERGIQRGVIIKDNPDVIAFSVWSYLHGISLLILQDKAKNVTDDIGEGVDSAVIKLMNYLYLGVKPKS